MSLNDTLLASIPVPVILVNGEDRISGLNGPAEELLNWSGRAAIGQVLADRLSCDPSLQSFLARVRRDGSPIFANLMSISVGQGKPVVCNLKCAPLAEQPASVLVMIEPRQISEHLENASSISSAAKSAIGMSEMLAHEIKNPLAGITGAAQLLAMSLNTQDREMTDLIVEETRRIVALLDQVEHFGNLMPPKRRAVNLHDILTQAKKSAQVGVAAHMRFVEDFDPSLPETYADADQLLQVLSNLIRNAAEAVHPAAGTITLRSYFDGGLRVRRPDGANANLPLQIEIIDDGPGIPNELARDIFEPFVSGRENGTGLGLALVSKIVSEHQGWITLVNESGKTVFRLSLPIAHAPEKEH